MPPPAAIQCLLPRHASAPHHASPTHCAPACFSSCHGPVRERSREAAHGVSTASLLSCLERGLSMGGDEILVVQQAVQALKTDPAWGETAATVSILSQLARALQTAKTDPQRGRELIIEILGLVRMTERLRASLAPEGGQCVPTCSQPCGSTFTNGATSNATTSSGVSTSSAVVLSSSTSPSSSCSEGTGRKRCAGCSCCTSASAGTNSMGTCSGTCHISSDDAGTERWAGETPTAKRRRLSDEMPPPAPRKPLMPPPPRPVAAPRAQQQQQQQQRSVSTLSKGSTASSSSTSSSGAPAPRSGALQRPAHSAPQPRAAPDAPPLVRTGTGSGSGVPAPVAQWQGRLLHRRGASVAELCSVAVQLPAAYYDQMPAALYATELAHRRSVPLGRHVVCRCTLLAGTSQRQLAALAAMANAQLVAVAPLQLCELIVVPYLDSHGRVRVVGFLRVFGD